MTCKIREARKVMREAFKDDPNFRDVYVANIAMYIFDREDIGGPAANKLAEGILDLIFGD